MRIREAQDFGAVARERRRELGLTQAELADRIGVTRQWVVRFEHGSSDVSLSKAFSVLRELDLTVRTSVPGHDRVSSRPEVKFDIPIIEIPKLDATRLRGLAATSAIDTQKLLSQVRTRIKQLDDQDRALTRALDE